MRRRPSLRKSCPSSKLRAVLEALRGKALGGSSAVNAAVAIRARAADFAKWSALGIRGWSFNEVLASYKAIENFAGWRRSLPRALWSPPHPRAEAGRAHALTQRLH